MPSHKQALTRALKHYEAGEFAQAQAVCMQIVQVDKRHADAWNLLGVLAHQAGDLNAALGHFERAAAVAPNVAAHRSNRGAILQTLGRHAEAEAEFREVLRRFPTMPEAHFNLGNVLRDLGRLDEAEACQRRALALRAAYPEAHNNLGNVLRDVGRLEEAEASFRRALQLMPAYCEAHTNLGTVLRDLGRHEEAETCFRAALRVNPAYVEALNNLGVLLTDQGRAAEALPLLERALQLRPDFGAAHNNLGNVLRDLGRQAEAEESYRRAVEKMPESADAHHNLALLLLLRGDYAHGWPEFEWRLRLKQFALPELPQPLWQGEALTGRTVLLHAEQGYGDTIQFVRYAPLLKARGASVVLHCSSRLTGILRTCRGVERVVPKDAEPPHFDVRVPLLSLPRLFGTTVETIPAPVPYITANPSLMETWRTRLADIPGERVGIVWQGAPGFRRDRFRSSALAEFAPLAQMPGVSLLSLQVGPGQEQLADAPFPVIDLGSRFDMASFDDAAAAIRNLDLLITVDTAQAHLAGALGAPVWVMLPFAPDWRWLLARENSPWYPTMRLFRQRRAGDWADVFERVAQQLAKQSIGTLT